PARCSSGWTTVQRDTSAHAAWKRTTLRACGGGDPPACEAAKGKASKAISGMMVDRNRLRMAGLRVGSRIASREVFAREGWVLHSGRSRSRGCRLGRPGMRMTMQEQAWAAALRRERAGDGSRYARFLEEYSSVLRRVVRSRLSAAGLDAQEAEDVVQEVLMAIHQRRDQWNDERPLLPWLGAISRYKTIDVLRRRRSELRMRIDLSDREWADLFAASDAPAVDAAARAEHM